MDILFLLIALVLICFPKQKAWAAIVILFISEDFFGLQGIFTEYSVLANPRDAGLLAALAFCSFYGRQAWRGWRGYSRKECRLRKLLGVLFVYILLIAFGDYIINGTTVFTILRTSRKWLLILFVLMAPIFSSRDVGKLLRILLWITLLHSVLVLYESIIQDYYWTRGNDRVGEIGEVRGSLPAPYALLYTSLLAFNIFRFKRWKVLMFLSVLVSSQLISGTRSIALALILIFIVAAFYQSKNKLTAVLKVLVTALFLVIVISSIPILRDRFIDVAHEQESAKQSGEVEGNTTFRLFLLLERYNYLKQHPGRYVFGIGNVHETDFPQIFKIGLRDEYGRITQLDTGDIVWALIILRLGMLGFFLVLLMHLYYLFYCWCSRYMLLKAVMGYMAANLFILSFAGTTLNGSLYLFLPTLMILVSYRLEKKIVLPYTRNIQVT